jgi:hypothetical protein
MSRRRWPPAHFDQGTFPLGSAARPAHRGGNPHYWPYILTHQRHGCRSMPRRRPIGAKIRGMAARLPPCHGRAWLGPIGIRIRSGQRQSIPSSSCPDLIRAPPQPPESERITGSSPAMTTGRDGVSGETILRRILILMPMGLGPATHDLRCWSRLRRVLQAFANGIGPNGQISGPSVLLRPRGTFATVRRQLPPHQTRIGHRCAHNLGQIRFTRSFGPPFPGLSAQPRLKSRVLRICPSL